ncbi:MAG TPA: EamA family transporter [Anaerolineales bacterium]|nr:EamA family transporter [Anaerolineales bacterium]
MKTKVWMALLAIYIVWGSTYLAIRFAVETIPPFLMAGMRFLISGLILYIWRRAAGDPMPTRRQWRSAVIVGLLLLLGGNGVVSWAEQHVASGIAALIVASIPLWVTLIDAVRPKGVKPDWKVMLGLLIGFGGIVLLVSQTEHAGSSTEMSVAGVAALLLAAFLWSLGSIYGRDADMPSSSLLGTGIEMLGGATGLFLAATFLGEWKQLDLSAITTRSMLGLAYLIVAGSLIGFTSYSWLLRNAPVSLVSTYAYVNPVVAIFLGAWLAGETINMPIIISALVIIASVVVINTSKQARPKEIRESSPEAAD